MKGTGLTKYCWALDLKDNADSIEEYKKHHQAVWPEIITSIKDAGIEELEIYQVGNRLFMIMIVNESFSIEKKASLDAANPKVQEWEERMWKYQQALPFSEAGEKWVLMERIFQLG
jgi:L-rhamnose mutarotase